MRWSYSLEALLIQHPCYCGFGWRGHLMSVCFKYFIPLWHEFWFRALCIKRTKTPDLSWIISFGNKCPDVFYRNKPDHANEAKHRDTKFVFIFFFFIFWRKLTHVYIFNILCELLNAYFCNTALNLD